MTRKITKEMAQRITDNLDTGSTVFESGVKDVVRDMTFRVEVY